MPSASPRRSELTCPGHSLKMMHKAAAAGADEVIFDLEDACAVSQKVAARATVAEALRTATFTPGTIRACRINGVHTPHCHGDLLEVLAGAGAYLDVVVLPKVHGADDVRFVDTLLSQAERFHGLTPGRIRLEVLLESAAGLLQAPAIAAASPRLESLIFGVADLAADLGAQGFRDYAPFVPARLQLLLAARAHGLLAIDSVTVQFRDAAQVEADARAGAALGFDGKWAIHPAQVPLINAAFTPSQEAVARARRVVEAYQQADAQGLGAVVLDDEMVDAATVRVEQRRLAVARRAGLLP
jgi:citrate lyase subunit beta / citryl-CoA lyase